MSTNTTDNIRFQNLNTSGRVVTIFLVITAILLISLTAISMFFFQKEIERRKIAEQTIGINQEKLVTLETELEEVKKQNFLLEEKNKEADERINSLLDELELEEGLREELKLENLAFKEQADKEKKEKETLKAKLTEGQTELEQKLVELEAKLKMEVDLNEELKQKLSAARSVESQLGSVQSASTGAMKTDTMIVENAQSSGVELDPIVVAPDAEEGSSGALNENAQGRILSVDHDTEFVIVNLGNKDGLKTGLVLSVYRGKDYLGDIKITRVQPEMSAADFIPPFSSRIVRKNDQVVIKN